MEKKDKAAKMTTKTKTLLLLLLCTFATLLAALEVQYGPCGGRSVVGCV